MCVCVGWGMGGHLQASHPPARAAACRCRLPARAPADLLVTPLLQLEAEMRAQPPAAAVAAAAAVGAGASSRAGTSVWALAAQDCCQVSGGA